jgi:hypothetical protein
VTQKAGLISILLRRRSTWPNLFPADEQQPEFHDLVLRRNGDKFVEPEYKELMDTGS